jgi:hypothetical protein
MRLSVPPRWFVACSSIAPATVSLSLDALLRSLELEGKVRVGDALGIAPAAGLLTLILCVGGSLLSAMWFTAERDIWTTLNVWVGLTILDVLLTVPGCSVIWS